MLSNHNTIDPAWSWPDFWAHIQAQLKHEGYRAGTRRAYRNVLRGFRAHSQCRPAEVTRRHIRDYLHHLGNRRLSTYWIGTNIAVLRTVFDRFCGAELTAGIRGPRHPLRIPHVVSPEEMRAVLDAAESLRDRLLMGLMYGCGMKVGEACRLCWRDIDVDTSVIKVRDDVHHRDRSLRIPRALLPVLKEGVQSCPPGAFVFLGRRTGTHLSVRMAEYIVHRVARSSGIGVPVTSMTLRHCFAVHSLQAGASGHSGARTGANIRELQEALGHLHIDTTMKYLRMMPPADIVTPLDALDTGILGPGESEVDLATAIPPPVEPFADPLDPAPLLAGDTWTDRVRAFTLALRTRLGPRFLSLRSPPDPPD